MLINLIGIARIITFVVAAVVHVIEIWNDGHTPQHVTTVWQWRQPDVL